MASNYYIFFGIFLVSMLFVPASMPTTEAQNSDYKKYTDDGGRFSIEYPDDWTIYTADTEFPMQQSKSYNSLVRSIGFYDEPFWTTTVQVFEHERDSWKWNGLNHILDISATDSEVLESLVFLEKTLCEIETFEDSVRKCFWSNTVDSYIFYTNDNKNVYIVKGVYSIEWWNMPMLCTQPCPVISISGVIYGENNIWEIVAETRPQVNVSAMAGPPYSKELTKELYDRIKQHDDAIMHMIKSFSLEPKSEQPASEPVTDIPEWIKNNAGWWADGQIDDSSFLQGIQFLIKEGIIVIPPTETSESSDSQEVPGWIKNNAGWWADGQIDDNSFVSGIQYLVKAGIIQVG